MSATGPSISPIGAGVKPTALSALFTPVESVHVHDVTMIYDYDVTVVDTGASFQTI